MGEIAAHLWYFKKKSHAPVYSVPDGER